MNPHGILPQVWNVPAAIQERLGDQAGRQRAMASEDHLLLVLHDPPSPEDNHRHGQLFWRQPDGTWSSKEFGSGTHAVENYLDQFMQSITRFEEQEQRATSATDYFAVLYGLAPIHRCARNMHQALQQARELCPQDRAIINFRDRAYQIEREAELLVGDAKTALDVLIAKRDEEQAKSSQKMSVASHRLNILVAFFFPMATLCSLYGVNLRHGLEDVQNISQFTSARPPSFPFLLMIVIGSVLGFFLMRFIKIKPQSRGQHPAKA